MGTQDPQGTQNSSTMKCNSYRLKHHPSYKIQSHPRKCIQEQKLQVEEANNKCVYLPSWFQTDS